MQVTLVSKHELRSVTKTRMRGVGVLDWHRRKTEVRIAGGMRVCCASGTRVEFAGDAIVCKLGTLALAYKSHEGCGVERRRRVLLFCEFFISFIVPR